jgi:hypothetical protein
MLFEEQETPGAPETPGDGGDDGGNGGDEGGAEGGDA